MSPPKVRLHKSTGKLKSIPRPSSNGSVQQVTSANASTVSTSDSSTSESDRQFELELYWCIQQLEETLNLAHVRESSKKSEDTTKLINTLKSASQPIIRKRQIMRNTFGDYRSKMAAEEQSLCVNPDNVRFKGKKDGIKYHFVKKSSILNGNKDFRFNFPTDGNGTTGPEEFPHTEPGWNSNGNGEKQAESTTSHTCQIVPSDNSFRFNFAPICE